MSIPLYQQVLEEAAKAGVTEFCVCPGSRNSLLVSTLMKSTELTKYFWYEERSAAFFALGRARATNKPVAVITTSGTAVGELLPAAMEAHYTGTPILLITADRPRRFRGTGAPQTAEQDGIFGVYVSFAQDIEGDEVCRLREWNKRGPAQLNVCFEEPKSYAPVYPKILLQEESKVEHHRLDLPVQTDLLDDFFLHSTYPLIIVSELPAQSRDAVTNFLLVLNAPIYCEAASGLRENLKLSVLQIRGEFVVWNLAQQNKYPIDGVLRLGGIPVTRLWRDLEDRPHQYAECSLSHLPFSGLSWGRHIQCTLEQFLPNYRLPKGWKCADFTEWSSADREYQNSISLLLQNEPNSEPAIYETLSQEIPKSSLVFLGNSLPVREWDLAATCEPRGYDVQMSRGLNGIDGQISTFLGLCRPGRDNWGIFGDLTTLYDFPALWILNHLKKMPIKVLVVNNGGGKLFSRIYKDPVFQHLHDFDFEHFAKSWRIPYLLLQRPIPATQVPEQTFIEIRPDSDATDRFWEAYDKIKKKLTGQHEN